MSSYRAIWTHFRQNFIIFVAAKISDPGQKSEIFRKYKSPHLAILITIWHIWKDRSQKVNNDEPDLRLFYGNFWPVISQAVQKPCFSAWIPTGPNFWKPLTCGYVAAGAFFSHKRGTHISGSSELVGTLPQAPFFFSQKKDPYFWKPWTCGYVAAGAFFPHKKTPHISASPQLVDTLPQAFFLFSRKMALIFLQAPNLWLRCRRRYFSEKNGPHISASP